MSKYALLYYPDFYPDPKWLRRILLFADEVKRIVPADVTLADPDGLRILQDLDPGCLSTIAPEENDVAIEEFELPRLSKAFAILGNTKNQDGSKEITFTISDNGGVSVGGHVFLHNEKISPKILEELERNRLIIKGMAEGLGREDSYLVNEDASNIILSGIAANIAERTGCDAITDKPLPFSLNSLNGLGIAKLGLAGGAEGVVLEALTSVLVPGGIETLKPAQYRDLRESHEPIRGAFKHLSGELALINRLGRISDPKLLQEQVKTAAEEVAKEYHAFRKSRYSRRFKRWVPFSIGNLLLATTALHPATKVVLELLGVRMAINFVDRILRVSTDQRKEETFNMVAGLRKDIIKKAKVKELI